MIKLVLVVLVSCLALSRGFPQGFEFQGTKTASSFTLSPSSPPKTIQSSNYPADAPANLEQVWTVSTSGKLHISCEEINFQTAPCNPLVLTDGRNPQKLCGDIKNFSYTTESNVAELRYSTGSNGGGKFKCTVQAV